MVQRAAKADVERRGVWRSELLAVVALLIFVAAVVWADQALQPNLTGGGLLLVGLVLALVPAALWLLFFYLQDRLEPEPIGDVARQFLIGTALAGTFSLPLLTSVVRVQEWLFRDTTSLLLGALLTGAVEVFTIYLTVRFFIFDSPEFDERTDGVVYGTAAGLGVATATNLAFILANGGAALGAGEIYVAEVALAQAAFGGLLGYFLGRAKLEREPAWWLASGFGLTVLLNALFTILRGQLEVGTISFGRAAQFPSLTGLVLAGALAILATFVVSVLVARDVERTRRGEAPPPAADAHVGDRQANALVVALFALLLAAGLLGWNAATRATTEFAAGGVRGSYPAAYADATGDGEILRVTDTLAGGSSFSVRAFPAASAEGLGGAAILLAGERGADAAFYRVTETTDALVAGLPAQRQRFAYVDTGALIGATPRIVEGVDYLVAVDGQVLVVSLTADSDAIGAVEPLFEQFVSSLQRP